MDAVLFFLQERYKNVFLTKLFYIIAQIRGGICKFVGEKNLIWLLLIPLLIPPFVYHVEKCAIYVPVLKYDVSLVVVGQ